MCAKPSETSSARLTTIETKKLKTNPNNPRAIRKDQLEKLVKSLKEFPEMLEARPIVVDPDYMILGGNMRLQAALQAGLKQVPVYVASWEEAKQKAFVIKDNVSFGEWDWDVLANEWEVDNLKEWGLYVPKWDDTSFESEIEDTGEYDYPEDLGPETGTRMVQLYMNTQTEPDFKRWELALREVYGTDNLTDTIYEVVKKAYEDYGEGA